MIAPLYKMKASHSEFEQRGENDEKQTSIGQSQYNNVQCLHKEATESYEEKN